jgi:hypothetical protein
MSTLLPRPVLTASEYSLLNLLRTVPIGNTQENIMKTTCILGLALSGLLTLTASAQNKYIDIEADSSTLLDSGADILNGGVTYSLATKNDVGENVYYPTLSTTDPLSGHVSDFRFYMAAHPGDTTPGEKMLINLVTSTQSFAPAWGVEKAVGFEVRLGPDYQVQTKNMQLSEWWQGSPYGAVVELILLPGTTQWALGIENDTNNTQAGAPAGEIILPGNTLNIGQWYKFEIAVNPEYTKNGYVQVWQDGKTVIQTYNYVVGYNPNQVVVPGGSGGLPMNGFDVEVGEYRPANDNDAEIHIDSVRWGDTYGDIK